MNVIRQNFHEEIEAGINRQINMELRASYLYQSMCFYFDRNDVALPGLSKYFSKSSKEEREHAEKFMTYMNRRGGRIILQDINRPDKDEWGSASDALQFALNLEKEVNHSLLKLHEAAGLKSDSHFCDFLDREFLDEQVESIKEISDMITKLKRSGPGLGEYIFDTNLEK